MAVDHKLLFLVVVFGILMPLGKEGTYKYLRSELSCDFSLRAEPFSKKKKIQGSYINFSDDLILRIYR